MEFGTIFGSGAVTGRIETRAGAYRPRKDSNEMKKHILIAILLLSFGIPAAALASSQVTTDLDFEIPGALNMYWAVDGSLVQLTGVNAITVNEFVLGYRDAISGGTLECDANENFDITVEANGVDFLGGSGSKNTSELFVDVEAAGSYAYQLNGTTAVTIIDEKAAGQDVQIPLQYKLMIEPDDTPGIYSTDLTYTILVD